MSLPPLTLRLRIVLCFAAVVVGLVVGMSWLFVHSQQAALSKLAAENSKLARSAADQQSAALDAALNDQIEASETELDTKARSLARLLADLAPTALLTFDTNALISLCKQATRDPDIERCIFFDPQGRKIAADEKAHAGRPAFKSGDTGLIAADVLQNRQKVGQIVLVVSFASAKEEGRKLEAGYADLQTTMNNVRAAMQNDLQKHSQSQVTRARWLGVEAGIGAMILGLLSALWISGTVTRSLRDAVVVFRKVEGGDLTPRITVSSRDEIGEMAHALNQTLDGLQRESLERSRVEEELRASKYAAEASSRAKSEFLANMSHEIRTPLNGVIGMTDLALETELSVEQKEYLDTVKLSADSLLGVINDILDFSKIEAGRIELDKADFNLRDCLETTLKTLALRADEKGLELLCEIAPEVPEVVEGDSSRLRQIVVNVVGNAIKFTHEGEVALKVDVEATDGEDRLLHFTVSDTGIGIPAEKQKLIFDPFSQADASTTRKYGGTGLGLTISTRLVNVMGGRIWVESEVGTGTQFHFTARFKSSEKKAEIGTTAPPEILRNVEVLVVDDNRTNRRILEGMLKRWEMQPVSVESGAQALAELARARESGASYRLVLTDMHMPDMDGFTLIEKIRQNPKLSTATIMMLTSAGHRGDGERCKTWGVAAYLLKPVRQSELREAIARVLGAREQAGAIPLITSYSLQDSRDPAHVLSVLLAEDNLVNQRLATRLLEKRGHRVTLAANGREALAAIEKQAYDLVLMDVQMPEMDGLEATIMLRQGEKGSERHQPVIALTAHAMKGDQERCLAAGMDGYLTKPIRPQEIDEILNKYVAIRKEGETPTPQEVRSAEQPVEPKSQPVQRVGF
jgi:signal transduction histidine kinase/DNA-binding response OmpR family regulator